jgi:hypothetical protein
MIKIKIMIMKRVDVGKPLGQGEGWAEFPTSEE